MKRTPKLEPQRPQPSIRSVVLDHLGRRFVVVSGSVDAVYARQLGPNGELFDAQCLLEVGSISNTGVKFEGDLA